MFNKYILFVLVFILLAVLLYSPVKELIFNTLLKKIYSDSELPTVKPSAVENMEEYVWLDSRSLEEYKVSHIKNAHWVGYKDFSLEKLDTIARDNPVIIYCSIGYRSQVIGEKMQEAGYRNVKNLYGGIFKWVNEGREIYSNGTVTNNIHPYNWKWGLLLNKGDKTY